MLVRMNHQWDPAPQPLNPKDRVAFDLIRATVNLTVASLLIAWATGRQLPLSTTYVTFMVAMGSSLADKAWGRESAVYRVTGVLTVISGWFMTGLAAFTLAAVMATILHYGQVYAIFGLLALVVVILVKSTIMHRKRESKLSVERFDQITEENILDVCSHQIVDSTLKLREIYNDTVENFFQGDRKALKELADAAERLAMTSSEHHKYDILPILYKMQSRSLDMGYHFVQALEHLNEATQSLSQFSESIFTYVDNNHTPFTIDQVDDLKEVHTALIKLLDEYCKMLQTGTYIQFDYTMVAQEQLLQLVAKATKRQIKRAQRNQTRTRSSLLYLNMLNEMRFMAVQVRALTCLLYTSPSHAHQQDQGIPGNDGILTGFAPHAVLRFVVMKTCVAAVCGMFMLLVSCSGSREFKPAFNQPLQPVMQPGFVYVDQVDVYKRQGRFVRPLPGQADVPHQQCVRRMCGVFRPHSAASGKRRQVR